MIVHPDFLMHWKTQRLVEVTGDKSSPLWLVGLWIYCQNKRNWIFEDFDSRSIAHACGAQIEPEKLLAFLAECKWIEIEGKRLTVRNWDTHNRMLVSAWVNGQKGGHPSKQGQSASGRVASRHPSGQPGGNRSTRAGGDRQIDRVGYLSVPQSSKPGSKLQLIQNAQRPDQNEDERPSPEQVTVNHKRFAALAREVARKLRTGEHVPDASDT